jgi:hypothetical protein
MERYQACARQKELSLSLQESQIFLLARAQMQNIDLKPNLAHAEFKSGVEARFKHARLEAIRAPESEIKFLSNAQAWRKTVARKNGSRLLSLGRSGRNSERKLT